MDPGYKIPKEIKKLDSDDDDVKAERACKRCGWVKEHYRIHHCGTCGRCVEYMDHHCYFSNSCIGKKNIREFVQFTFYTMMFAIYVII